MAKTKTFSVNTQKDPDTLVSEAKQVAKENDATFEGHLGNLLGERRRRQLRDTGPDGGGHHNRQAFSGSLV